MQDEAIKAALREAERDAIAALDLAAAMPTAARCQAFVRAFVSAEQWAVQDVARYREKVRAAQEPTQTCGGNTQSSAQEGGR